MPKLTFNQKQAIQNQKYQRLEALNFLNINWYYYFYLIYYFLYVITTILQVSDYYEKCLAKQTSTFKCSYVAASFRVMIIFAVIPIQILLIEGMKKMTGESLNWF